jgi:hypothetical protein
VTVPAALPGILAANLLGMGRVIGETMAVMMVTGNAAVVTLSPLESVRTMTVTIAAEMGEVSLRKKVGMVLQVSNPLPKSVFDNVAYGPRLHGLKDRGRLAEIVEHCLVRGVHWPGAKIWNSASWAPR